jgi:hypothetical protein
LLPAAGRTDVQIEMFNSILVIVLLFRAAIKIIVTVALVRVCMRLGIHHQRIISINVEQFGRKYFIL